MERIITVKGTGTVISRPDTIEMPIMLCAREEQCDKAIRKNAEQYEKVKNALLKLGISKDAIKSDVYSVDVSYTQIRDDFGTCRRVEDGFMCVHNVKVRFALDMDKLAKVIAAVSECGANAKLNVLFTVEDTERIGKELLRSAAKNAREKAAVLCEASGVKLGELKCIDYSWGTMQIYSDVCFESKIELPDNGLAEINPTDIENSDSATFVWSIE